MSKSYWRSAKIRSLGFGILICLVLFMAPQVVFYAGNGSYWGLPYTLIILVVAIPLVLLLLTLCKISLQRRLDRNHDIDKEDRLQRRSHPKIMRSFPVDGTENNEFHWPLGVNPNAENSFASAESDSQNSPDNSSGTAEGQKQ